MSCFALKPTPSATGGTLWDVLLVTLFTDPATPQNLGGQPTADPAAREVDLSDIRASRNGDADAYARLIHRYRPRVAARMWKFTRDRNDYEELVHEVFVEAYFSLPRYREMNSFPNWLNRIATRVGYRYWKRRRRARQTDRFEENLDLPATNNENTDPHEAASKLHRLLGQLNPRDRLVLTLLYWEGCSVAEAARQTGWSRAMVKVQAYRARARLRKLLEKT